MELLMDNLRRRFRRGKHAEQTFQHLGEYAWLISRVALAAVLAFLLGRAAVIWETGACTMGLMAALLARDKGNIYVLPLTGAGMALSGSFPDVWQNLLPVLLCGLFFFLLDRKKLSLANRAWITAGLWVGGHFLCLWIFDSFTSFDWMGLTLQVLVVMAFVYIFTRFFEMTEERFSGSLPRGEAVIIASAVGIMAVFGLFGPLSWPLIPAQAAALFITLFAGHRFGIPEGALAGLTTGVLLFTVQGAGLSLLGILGFCGLVAGFFKGHPRIFAGVCFAAAGLVFSGVRGAPSLYFSVWEVLAAALLFVLLPESFLRGAEAFLPYLCKTELHGELTLKDRIRKSLSAYINVFQELSLTYGRPGGNSPARDLLSRQFKGMAKALENLSGELIHPPRRLRSPSARFQLRMGTSGYSRCGDPSGDSCLCAELRDNQYMIALSDGMGKGARAAEESSLAVNTLHSLLKAGFDAELALQLLNSLLFLNSEDEIFSTMDLGLFHLGTGRLRLFKIGAAATFIKRGERVEAVKVSALPAGIVPRIPVEHVDIKLRPGDEIIIVSDGITEAAAGEDGLDWLCEAISGIRSRDPQTLADLVLRQAIQRWGIREKDDMTVIAVRVAGN
ncbi:MAG: SpoIIE family protein phosphatase [Firmicutes bacterium]|nr:SpoIIE family protein phosphatase [Bacillota bacterium]